MRQPLSNVTITGLRTEGMTADEAVIALAWLEKHVSEFDSVEFNLRIGTPQDLGVGYTEEIRRQAALNSQKRVDMIAFDGKEVTIVEVKVRIALGALGQLLGYRHLFQEDHPMFAVVRLVAIGHDALIDVPEVFRAHGVDVELFPDVRLYDFPQGS